MHRRPFRQPGYLLHKPSNQAYVRIKGRMIYLGAYDSVYQLASLEHLSHLSDSVVDEYAEAGD